MSCRKSTKLAAGYARNAAGFSCGVCKHFDGKNRCAIVKGGIRKKDCCNLFASSTYKPSR